MGEALGAEESEIGCGKLGGSPRQVRRSLRGVWGLPEAPPEGGVQGAAGAGAARGRPAGSGLGKGAAGAGLAALLAALVGSPRGKGKLQGPGLRADDEQKPSSGIA